VHFSDRLEKKTGQRTLTSGTQPMEGMAAAHWFSLPARQTQPVPVIAQLVALARSSDCDGRDFE
jgi:hypothetical protein